MRAQIAVPPHSHVLRGSIGTALPGLGSARWHWQCFRCSPMPRFLYCRESQVHHGTAAHLESWTKSWYCRSPPSPCKKETSCGFLSQEEKQSLTVDTLVSHVPSLVLLSPSQTLRPTLHTQWTAAGVGPSFPTRGRRRSVVIYVVKDREDEGVPRSDLTRPSTPPRAHAAGHARCTRVEAYMRYSVRTTNWENRGPRNRKGTLQTTSTRRCPPQGPGKDRRR